MDKPRSSSMITNAAQRRHKPGRPRAGALSERRRLLLDVARELFVARGFSEASLAEIARNAHVALRTIYLQYGGKDGLLRALIQEEGELHCAELAALRLEEKALPAQLESLALHVADRVSRPHLLRLYTVVQATSDSTLIEAFSDAGPGKIKATLDGLLRPAFGNAAIHGIHTIESLCDHFLACVTPGRAVPIPTRDAAVEHARRGLDLFLRVLPH